MLICDQQPMFSQTHSSIGLLDGPFRNKMSTSSNDNILEKRVRTPILFIHHAAVQSAGDNIDFLYNLLINSFLNIEYEYNVPNQGYWMLSNSNLWNDCQICHEILDTNNDAGALAQFKLGEIFSPPTIVFGYVTIVFKVSKLSQLCENAHQCFLIEVNTKSFTVSHFIPMPPAIWTMAW